MDYLALYRKYRPSELDEVVGQKEIKKILASSVNNGTITHAYLFSGPRGTGKTTMAKILAKMVNCLSPIDGNACGKCDICKNILDSNDVIEIDAASNNGVDEIRELREKANLVPSNAKYKVYIIDEVHMLTTQAFNALLKTLEEPPKHVIFILATTEYYKIPLTITSRCQKFQFNKITDEDIVDRLKYISIQENINIDDDALFEIAKISDGGMRDSINFLDQLRSFNNESISINDVYEVCGNISNDDFVNLFTVIRNNDVEKVTAFFEKMNETGKNYSKFNDDVVDYLKDIILYKKNVSNKYIRNDIESIKKISNLFTFDEIFLIVDEINKLIDRLKNVSRQSIAVTINYLSLMNKLNHIENNSLESNFKNDTKKLNTNTETSNYDMAFQFTVNRQDDTDKLTVNDDDKVIDEEINNDSTSLDNFNKNKDIIINNTFAVANKDKKNSLQDIFANIGDYLTDKKFMIAAGILIDLQIEVAGDGYIIFTAKNDAIVDKIYSNFKLCQELISTIFNSEFIFTVITIDEWKKYRDDYIKNVKAGKKYKLIELVEQNALFDEENIKKEPTVVDKLFDLVGEDIVEFR